MIKRPSLLPRRHKIILLCLAGSALEWYDFAIFSSFATLIAQIFFPSDNKFLNLLATFIIFASGFIVRPLGAFCLGSYGDRKGRRKSLSLSIILMTVATIGMGLIPGYATIGFAAPLLLFSCRLLQGFSVGAEYSGAITYLTETSAPEHRAFNTSFSLLGTVVGSLLGSLFCALISSWFSPEQMLHYAWRIPFLAGFPLGYLGYYLRKKAVETPEFIKIVQTQQVLKNPFWTMLQHRKTALITTFLLFAPGYLLIYLFVVYFPNKLYHLHVITLTRMLYTNFCNLSLEALLIPIVGWIGDKVGVDKPIKWGFILLFVLVLPIFYCSAHNQWRYFFVAQMLAVIVYSVLVSCMPHFVATLFDTPTRFSGVSTGLNLSACLLGGTAPLVGMLSEKLSYGFIWLSGYTLILSVLGFFALLKTVNQFAAKEWR